MPAKRPILLMKENTKRKKRLKTGTDIKRLQEGQGVQIPRGSWASFFISDFIYGKRKEKKIK